MDGFTPEESLRIQTAWKALDDKFGTDIVVLDIHNISTIADCFIIASGNNPSQIRAMADEAEERLGKLGARLHHSEGMRTMNWVLLDFGSIVIHIFDKENRGFYNLERIWRDGAVIPESALKAASV
ncbi:MAG: ribosome silencing factor [Clostridiales bacterium]|jgi:ribosome-associated protein|nr:ribosome silencing factor [Clostridiales bacterium]